jgi:hypothetical protein
MRRRYHHGLALRGPCDAARRGCVRARPTRSPPCPTCSACLDKLQPVHGIGDEHAVHGDDVKVRTQREAAVEALNKRDRADVSFALAALVAIVGLELATERAQKTLAQLVVVADAVAKAVRDREHPLAHGYVRDDMIDQASSRLRHALVTPALAKRAALARQRHQPLMAAIGGSGRNRAPRLAFEKCAQLLFNEARHTAAVVCFGGVAQEGLEVSLDRSCTARPLQDGRARSASSSTAGKLPAVDERFRPRLTRST